MPEQRQRLLQDLHDGMGHELLGALLLARSPDAPREAVAAQITRAMDCLRLTVDAWQPEGHGIEGILGSLRHRMSRHFAEARVVLDWDVGPLPPIQGWNAGHARELQLLMYEAFTNLLRHSGASRARLRARYEAPAQCIGIVLQDDGRGWSPAAPHGNGIASMKSRASRLGGTLLLAAGDEPLGGARLELRLPAPAAAGTS